MALEPSEIFTAAAMCFGKKSLIEARQDIPQMLDFFLECEAVAKDGSVVFAENRSQFLNFFKEPLKNPGNIIDMSRAISAAIAIQDWMRKNHKVSEPAADVVFMTGNVWPKEVQPLAIKANGFDAYNSSDIIIKPQGMPNAYFGVSLKKKPKPNDQDPTLINKAFDTILIGDEFESIKKELEKIREDYFSGLVKEAVKSGLIDLNISGKTNAQLFKPNKTVRNKEGFERIYIDTKGSMKMPEIGKDPKNPVQKGWDNYGDDKLNRSLLSSRKDTMRAWVNSKLGETNNPLYKSFLKVMNDNSDTFASQLINLTLKTDLPKLMKVKNLGEMTFGFALVTGIGDGSRGTKLFEETGKITTYQGKAYDIHSILCGLSDMDSNSNSYEFKITNKFEVDSNLDEAGAAKLKFDLVKNKIPLLRMELRYKGGFGGQPQFFAVMTKEFKTIIEDRCLIKGKDGAR